MVYRGYIRNGVAILEAPAALPDGTPVRVIVDRGPSPFWQNKTVLELAAEQGIGPVRDVGDLAGDWPQEDSIDELLDFLREVRR